MCWGVPYISIKYFVFAQTTEDWFTIFRFNFIAFFLRSDARHVTRNTVPRAPCKIVKLIIISALIRFRYQIHSNRVYNFSNLHSSKMQITNHILST